MRYSAKFEGNRSSSRAGVSGVKALSCFVGLLLITACSVENRNTAPFDFKKQIGWMHGPCLAIQNDTLDIGDVITAVTLEEKQSLTTATITGIATSGVECLALLDDRRSINDSGNRSFYTVSFTTETPPTMLAIGIVGSSPRLSVADDSVVGDIDADGQLEVIGSCNTSEGINFYVSAEIKDIDRPRWIDYYYLGYDIMPTCSD